MKDDRLYLVHISECLERIRRYTREGREAFFSQQIVQDAVIRNLQIPAESTQRLSDELKSRRPEIDWRGISGFRIVAAHGYLGVDLQPVWSIVDEDVEPLENAIRELLAFLESK